MDKTKEIPVHADFQRAPGVMEGSMEYELSPDECNIPWWIDSVAQGAWMGLDRGKRPGSEVPDYLRAPGPLRDSLMVEFAFRSLTEWEAVRICALASASAPEVRTMEFFATQTLDEARHAETFRDHLLDLGVPREELLDTVERLARPDAIKLIKPLWDWGWPQFQNGKEAGTWFIDTVVIITILLEGVLAPTSELSERKWKPFSPATADIERGACVDEIRHLSVGSWVIREHVQNNPGDKDRMVELVAEGRQIWATLPTAEIVYAREKLFQEGLEQHGHVIGDYELIEGRPLVDTTPEERMQIALEWSTEIQASRLEYMGLEAAMAEEVRL
ncbi:MAG: VlmB-like protein [Actinomycetota bacterium]|nr:VlmB-like protein [Actinomycetota bacterium]